MNRDTPPQIGMMAIGTALPPSIAQSAIAQLNEDYSCGDDQQRAFLRRIYSRAGIDFRGIVLGSDEGLRAYFPPPGSPADHGPSTAARMHRYAAEAPPLAAAACTDALARAGASPSAITHLITVSCTGFGAPGLDAELIRRLDLRLNIHRLHIGFMGCHAALNALDAARSIALADCGAVVLVCCVELCSLHFAYPWSPSNIVANSLFADAAAAAVIGQIKAEAAPLWKLHKSASLLIPETLDAMTWRIGDHGFEMTLSSDLPAIVQTHLRGWCKHWLEIPLEKIAQWAVHPGGPKILSAAGAALGLGDDALRHSRQILADHGNISSTTILFILQRIAAQDAAGLCVALAFGPGLMMEGLLLER